MASSKPTARRKNARPGRGGESRGGSWLSFVSGALVGAAAVYLVMVYRPGVTIPEPWGGGPDESVSATQIENEAAEPSSAEPEFQFFNILPEMEVRVFDWELKKDEPKPAERAPEASGPDYVIQVGSFRQLTEADRLKARLAMSGVKAAIQRVIINGQDVWFRVHVGPYSDREALAQMRTTLSKLGIQHIVLRKTG